MTGHDSRALQELRHRLRTAAAVMLTTFLVGVVGFRIIGGDDHSWLEAVYMTANALTTSGFREAIDISSSATGLIFTSLMLVFGAGAVVYSISLITAFVVEGDLTQGFRRRRMLRAIQEMQGHHIVCGAGATGTAVIRELVKTRHDIVVIEADEGRLERVQAEHPDVPVLLADFTDDQVLLQAGIERAAGIVISTTIDKDSLVTTVTARQLNPTIRIIARAANDRSIARLRAAGADGVVSPAMIGGMRMASELVRPTVVSFLDMMLRDTERNLRVEEVKIPDGSEWVGRTLSELDAHRRANALVLAVRSPEDGEYLYNPPDSYVLNAGEILIVMGDPAGVRTLRHLCAVAATATALELHTGTSV